MIRAGWTVFGVLVGVTIAFGDVTPPVVAPKPGDRGEFHGCPSCRFLTAPSRASIRLVQNGPTFLTPEQTPKPLPPTEDAIPLPSPEEAPVLGGLLDRYLPDASPDERRVWADELRLLPPEIARDLLAARSKLGEPRTLFEPPATGFVPPPQSEPTEEAVPSHMPRKVAAEPMGKLRRTLATLREIETIHLHNVANAESVGFKRLRPSPLEATQNSGVDGVTVERIESQGLLLTTGRPFDLAVEGAGYFQVRGGDSIALTRRGSFTLTMAGELALKVGESMWSMYPSISIPPEATNVQVLENGTVVGLLPGENEITLGQIELVRICDASTLESAGGGLLAVPELAGRVIGGLPGDNGLGTIHQNCLERSNVDLAAEIESLERLRRQVSALEEADLPRVANPMADTRHR